jgi:hypothetical protein
MNGKVSEKKSGWMVMDRKMDGGKVDDRKG